MPVEPIDLIIHARWIIPIIPKGTVLNNCSLAINNGIIINILPHNEAKRLYSATEEFDLYQHAIIPGLINAHCHSAMSLLRGYADDQPLQEWLEKSIWPTESKWVSPEFVRDGSELAIAEMIRSGTTAFADMYFFPEETALAAAKSGIRCQLAFPILDFPTAWGQGPDEYISKGLALRDNYRSHELIKIAFGPHAPYTVSDSALKRIAMLAEELQAPIQIHLHETAAEIDDAIEATGKRPLARLHELGLLSPLTQCVHMTQLIDADIELLQQNGCHVIHCPESNLKLASGFCPSATLLDNNINVALGTDGAASNNDLNLFDEMKTASLLAKAVSKNATAINAHTALAMATLNGAIAMGIDDKVGSLEKGKLADITAIEFNELEHTPLFNPVSHLVYTACAHKVSHVWVNGRCLLNERQLQTLNSNHIQQKAHQWQSRIDTNSTEITDKL
jgi:5-methylthioadenosine/S-adenosylhomocysteine deaminase